MRTDTSRCTSPAYMCMVSKGQPHYCIVQFPIVSMEMGKLLIPIETSMHLFRVEETNGRHDVCTVSSSFSRTECTRCLPGFDAIAFRSKSLMYVESIASEQMGTMCRLIGADRGKCTHAVIVKFSRPRSSSGCRIVFGFFYWKKKQQFDKWLSTDIQEQREKE